MASKAITGLRGEGTKAKRPIGNVAIDGIATGRGQTDPFGTTTAGAECTYLEASQLPPALIHHHLHGNCTPICLLIMKIEKRVTNYYTLIWILGERREDSHSHWTLNWNLKNTEEEGQGQVFLLKSERKVTPLVPILCSLLSRIKAGVEWRTVKQGP
ncbi:hypothetical protein SESBI_22811 [Sesbania bispinosa]|nr:hypothetical protein SESBI_22811 [Sesbania bispinosa]